MHILAETLSFNLGLAIKYIWWSSHDSHDRLYELREARWFLDREIQRLVSQESVEQQLQQAEQEMTPCPPPKPTEPSASSTD